VTLRGLFDQLKKDYRKHDASLKNPALWAVATYRFGRWANDLPPGAARSAASKAYSVMFLGVELTSGIVFNREAVVGEEFHLIHWGNTKIHPGVVIGNRVGIMHDVTLGTTMERPGVPRIGNDVFIGAGAKILGPVTITRPLLRLIASTAFAKASPRSPASASVSIFSPASSHSSVRRADRAAICVRRSRSEMSAWDGSANVFIGRLSADSNSDSRSIAYHCAGKNAAGSSPVFHLRVENVTFLPCPA
jgi:serine O-acetyltransferase